MTNFGWFLIYIVGVPAALLVLAVGIVAIGVCSIRRGWAAIQARLDARFDQHIDDALAQLMDPPMLGTDEQVLAEFEAEVADLVHPSLQDCYLTPGEDF